MLIIISKTLPITTVKPTPNRNGRQRPFYGKTKKIDIHEKIITNPVLRRNTNNCRFSVFQPMQNSFTVYHKNKLKYEIYFKIVEYISTIYFYDKTKGTIHKSKNKQ